MPQANYVIVGARFRPPAKALLDTLPLGTQLLARREPQNAYDPNAIQVLVHPNDFQSTDALRIQCEQYGKSIEEIMGASEWHLGYVPREEAAKVAPRMDHDAITAIVGSLTFSAQGVPCIRLEVPIAEEVPNART